MAVDTASPRFAAPAAAQRGHYESFYLKAAQPGGGRAVWVRYTTHQRPGAQARGSVWATLFDAGRPAPLAVKQTFAPELLSAPDGGWAAMAGSTIGPGSARGDAEAGRHRGSWDVTWSSAEAPLPHLPRDWMYEARVPRTKPVSLVPSGRFSGRLEIDGETVELDGWPGMVGHNWGSEHADRWIWLHGSGFPGHGDDTWFDLAIARVRLGPVRTPWLGGGTLSLGGRRIPVGGLRRGLRVEETPAGCRLTVPAGRDRLTVTVHTTDGQMVAWPYADPAGGEHHSLNCSIADLGLELSRGDGAPLRLELPAGAAYELGVKETDHGIAVQPFPDGD